MTANQAELRLRSGAPLGGVKERPASTRAVRLLDGVVVACALALVAAGLWLSAGELLLVRTSAGYAAAPGCARPTEALTGAGCVAQVPATVDSLFIVTSPQSTTQPLVIAAVPSLGGARLTLTIPRPPAGFYQLKAGEQVSLKIWKGQVTAVFLPSGDALRTAASPYLLESLELSTGLFGFGMGAVLLLIHPPGRIGRWMSTRTRWHRPEDEDGLRRGLVDRMRRDRFLGLGFLAFTVMQLLDIITTINDSARGFFEANPLAATLINTYGPFLGFLAIKLPATIALLLGVARLPRRIALVVIGCGVALMIYIVGQNVALYAFGATA